MAIQRSSICKAFLDVICFLNPLQNQKPVGLAEESGAVLFPRSSGALLALLGLTVGVYGVF